MGLRSVGIERRQIVVRRKVATDNNFTYNSDFAGYHVVFTVDSDKHIMMWLRFPQESPLDALIAVWMAYHGYDYSTVQIGDQCWFAENLRTTKYANGDSISIVLPTNEWVSCKALPCLLNVQRDVETSVVSANGMDFGLWGPYYNRERAVQTHEPSNLCNGRMATCIFLPF